MVGSWLFDLARIVIGTFRSLEPILLSLIEELDIARRNPTDFLPLLSTVDVVSGVLFTLIMLSSSVEWPLEYVSRSSSLEKFSESILDTELSLEELRIGRSQVVERRGRWFQRFGLIVSSTDPCRLRLSRVGKRAACSSSSGSSCTLPSVATTDGTVDVEVPGRFGTESECRLRLKEPNLVKDILACCRVMDSNRDAGSAQSTASRKWQSTSVRLCRRLAY